MFCLEACRVKVDTAAQRGRVNTAAVYTLRKALSGLVCGPLDKNPGELWMCCPCLYRKAVDKLYATGGGDYTVVHPQKVTPYQRKKCTPSELLTAVTSTQKQKNRQRGDVRDVILAWKHYYKAQRWNN